MPISPINNRGTEAGFTLVEAVIAFAVAALGIGALIAAGANAIAAAERDGLRAAALIEAENALTLALAGPLQAGETRRRAGDFILTLTVRPGEDRRAGRRLVSVTMSIADARGEILRLQTQRLRAIDGDAP